MHIAIDVRALQTPGSRDRGLGYGLKGWLTEFLKLPYRHQVTLLTDPRLDLPDLGVPLSGDFWNVAAFESHPETMRLPDVHAEYLAYQNTTRFLQKQKVDLFHVHSPFETVVTIGYTPASCRCVATFHDALPILFPNAYLVGGGEQYAAAYYIKLQSLRYCERVVTISQSAADDLLKFTDIPADRVDVIYYAPSPDMFERPTAEDVVRSMWLQRIGGRYIFALLGDNPTKNVERLVAAFCQLSPEIRQQYKLVITYRIPEWHQATVRAWLEKYRAGEQVIFTGWVSPEELRVLYANANLYVHPALYEGFGMPIVEAMALGTPVIVSNTGPMPEIVGNAALTFDPYDVAAITETIQRVLQDRDLREDLGRRARVRVQDFTWQKAALAMRETYERALNSSAPCRLSASAVVWKETPERELSKLTPLADVMDRAYTVSSTVPVVGRLSAWIRRNSTTHLREAYFDVILERQEAFNRELARGLQVAWRILLDRDRVWNLFITDHQLPGSDLARQILAEATQLAPPLCIYDGYLLAGPLPEYGECLGHEFYEQLHWISMVSSPEVAAQQKRLNIQWVMAIHKIAWHLEAYYEWLAALRGAVLFQLQRLGADVMLKEYTLHSDIPLVGPLLVLGRRHLTSHVLEPYVTPALERQAAFNRLAVRSLRHIMSFNPALLYALESAANILLAGYSIRSDKPLIGPLIAAIRRDLTAHVKEPYIDPTFARQVAFNKAVTAAFGDIQRQVTNLKVREIYEGLPDELQLNQEVQGLKREVAAAMQSDGVLVAGQKAFCKGMLQLSDRIISRIEEGL